MEMIINEMKYIAAGLTLTSYRNTELRECSYAITGGDSISIKVTGSAGFTALIWFKLILWV